ncbi:MAG: stage II sporulation protein E [Romboutsia sp.]
MQRSEMLLKNNKSIGLKLDTITIIFMIMGFLLSRSILVESMAPLGVAFFIYISKVDRYKIPVFMGTLMGILLSLNDTVYIIKYSVCLVLFMIMSKKLKEINSLPKVALIGSLVVLFISVGQAFLSSRYMYDLFIAGMEGVITFIAIYIFSFGVSFLSNLKNKISVRTEEAISISLLITFSIMGIGGLSLFGVSVRSVLATVLILVASIVGGGTIGATSGVMVGIAFLINNITTAIYMGIYSFAGLVSGAFNKINRYFCILGYILSWIIIYSYTSGIGSNIMEFRDILIACLIVILLPDKFFAKVEKIIKSNVASNDVVYDYIRRSKNLTNNRLMNMYKAYDELADTFDRIREKEKILDQRDIASVVDMIHNDECKTCGMKRMCWENKFNHTYSMMYNILESLEEHGQITINNIPEDFRKECMKPESIVKISNYYYKMFVLDYNWSSKFSESRKLIANQIRTISKSIENLSKDLESNIMLDLEKEKSIYDELDRYGIGVDRVTYITKNRDEFEINIEKKTCRDCKMCEKKLIDIVSDMVGETLSAQKIGCHPLGERCKISLSKAQKFKAVTDVSSMSRDGHVYCGDNYTHMEINDGKYMMAISDGMGKGQKAYEESSITIDILEKMVDAKIDDEIVINTINNMLLLKSSDEMFSTLDLGIMDLKRGYLETIKMGACSTYIKRENGEVDLISSSSLPVGILSDINLDRQQVKVKDGDYIVMVSDGIIDAGKNKNLGDNWLIYFLQKIDTTNPKEISNMILDRALDIQCGEVEDDMTALVTKICAS